jgi:hypothetical protein
MAAEHHLGGFPMTQPEPLSECEEACGSSCHASDCEHHGHLPVMCAEPDCSARPHRLVVESHTFDAERPAATEPPAPPAPVGELDVEALMIAVFNADRPGDWPTRADHLAAFGTPGPPPWRRTAKRIAAEYARLTAEPTPEPES